MLRALLLTFVLLAFSRAASAQDVSGITILSYGIYRANVEFEKATPVEKMAEARATNICHVMTTWIVPSNDKHLFGVAYRIDGAPRGELVEIRRAVRFPDPKKPGDGPDGYSVAEGTIRRPIGVLSYGGWGIDESQKPGSWNAQLFHGGRKLIDLNFTITADKSFKVVPDARSDCFLVSDVKQQPNVRIADR